MSEKNAADIAVIGAGPAGIAASIYLKRAGRSILLFEERAPGGLLRNANLVENYPGFPGGISGPDLASAMTRHLANAGVEVIRRKAGPVVLLSDGAFRLRAGKDRYHADCVIIATGTRPRKTGLRGLGQVKGRVFCEIADIPDPRIRGRRMIIVGGGDAAFDYALGTLSRGGIPIVVSRSGFKALPLLRRRAEEWRIECHANAGPLKIRAGRNGIRVICRVAGRTREIEGDHLLIACGREPSVPVLGASLGKRVGPARGRIETPVPGLFFAGDIIRGRLRQTGVAVGDGIRAAMRADEYLKSRGEQLGHRR